MVDEIKVECDCGCGNGLHVCIYGEDNDAYVSVTTTASVFFERQCGIFEKLMNRIKAAWFMLCGKEYLMHDIVLSYEQWNEFVDAVNKVHAKDEFDK